MGIVAPSDLGREEFIENGPDPPLWIAIIIIAVHLPFAIAHEGLHWMGRKLRLSIDKRKEKT